MQTTSPSLLERLKRTGEDQAWERFVLLYTPFIFGIARQIGIDRDEASDLVQDVFVLLFQKMSAFKYDPNGSFRAWLRTVVTRRIYEIARRKKISLVTGFESIDAELKPITNAFDEQEYRLYLTARAMEIMQREFAPKTWKACWAIVVNGKSGAEVAEELGMSEGAVYVAKFRVLNRLREELSGLL